MKVKTVIEVEIEEEDGEDVNVDLLKYILTQKIRARIDALLEELQVPDSTGKMEYVGRVETRIS